MKWIQSFLDLFLIFIVNFSQGVRHLFPGDMGRKFYLGNPEDFNNPVFVENFVQLLMEKSINVRWAIEKWDVYL